jgi:large subunit ribosomal protein L5e
VFFSSSTRRFPGFSREGKKFNADVHRQHIFGLHVASYMTSLKDDNPDLYAKQFSRFVRAGIEPTSVCLIGFIGKIFHGLICF